MIKSPIVGDVFTAIQLQAIELLAIGDLSHQEIATQIGVTPQTISNWKRNYQFTDAIINRSREILKEGLPILYKHAMKYAQDGSVGYFRTLLEHMEKLESQQATRAGAQITFTWDVDDADKD